MARILPGLHAAAPAVLMAAGCVPFAGENVPAEIRAGGACLAAIAMILADLQTGKKLGYTDKIVSAMRTIPGMEDANEGTVLGVLSLSVSGFLGVPSTLDMIHNGPSTAHMINNVYNYVAFPIGAAFAFNSSRRLLDKMLGSEMRFKYTDTEGKEQETAPINTGNLLQQVAFFSGAAGITAFGTVLNASDIQFTGLMFMASNGLTIKRLTSEPVSEVMAAKMQNLAKNLRERSEELGDEGKIKKTDYEALCAQWDKVMEQWESEHPVKSVDIANLMRRGVGLLSGIVGNYLMPAKKQEQSNQL